MGKYRLKVKVSKRVNVMCKHSSNDKLSWGKVWEIANVI